jgi:hypothetical protein
MATSSEVDFRIGGCRSRLSESLAADGDLPTRKVRTLRSYQFVNRAVPDVQPGSACASQKPYPV